MFCFSSKYLKIFLLRLLLWPICYLEVYCLNFNYLGFSSPNLFPATILSVSSLILLWSERIVHITCSFKFVLRPIHLFWWIFCENLRMFCSRMKYSVIPIKFIWLLVVFSSTVYLLIFQLFESVTDWEVLKSTGIVDLSISPCSLVFASHILMLCC